MSKSFAIFICIISICMIQSCQNCSNPVSTPDPVTKSMFFKAGSYFVYNDSTDHITDSQYVYYYNYGIDPTSSILIDGCWQSYDQINMTEISYRNSLFYDSIYESGVIYISDSKRFWISGGYVYGADLIVPNPMTVNGILYPAVYKGYQQLIVDNSDTIPTDLYFASNYGIIKRVEHRPTGDVSWDLIRYHIVQ